MIRTVTRTNEVIQTSNMPLSFTAVSYDAAMMSLDSCIFSRSRDPVPEPKKKTYVRTLMLSLYT